MDSLHTWTHDQCWEELSFDISITNVKITFKCQRSKIVKIGDNCLILEWIFFILWYKISVDKTFTLVNIFLTLTSEWPWPCKYFLTFNNGYNLFIVEWICFILAQKIAYQGHTYRSKVIMRQSFKNNLKHYSR